MEKFLTIKNKLMAIQKVDLGIPSLEFTLTRVGRKCMEIYCRKPWGAGGKRLQIAQREIVFVGRTRSEAV